jgi:hypothetical protein
MFLHLTQISAVSTVAQMETQGAENLEAKAMGEKLGEVYKIALKYSMKKDMG